MSVPIADALGAAAHNAKIADAVNRLTVGLRCDVYARLNARLLFHRNPRILGHILIEIKHHED